MTLDETIRMMINEELDKRERKTDLVRISDFCKSKNISRTTLWRAEKEGRLTMTRIGKKVFINMNQFI